MPPTASDRYRVTPRPGLRPSPHPAYGLVWPADGRIVTPDDVGIFVLQKLDADPRFTVERLPPEPTRDPPPPPTPIRSRRRRKR